MRRAGVSLIETLLGMSILLLAMVLCFSLLPSSWLAVNTGEQRLYAGNLAQSLLEQQRARNFESIVAENLYEVEAAGATYHPSVEVEPVPGPSPERLKVVRVRVKWKSRQIDREVVRQATLCRLPR